MAFLFKEKTKAPAVSILMQQENAVKEPKIRSLTKKAASLATLPLRYLGTSFLWGSLAAAAWAGPAIGVVGGFVLTFVSALAADYSSSVEHDEVTRDRLLGTAAFSLVFALASAGVCLHHINATPEEKGRSSSVYQDVYSNLRAQYIAGQTDVTATRHVEGRRYTPSNWGSVSHNGDIQFEVLADKVQPIGVRGICRPGDEKLATALGGKNACTAFLSDGQESGRAMVSNKEGCGCASYPGFVVKRDGMEIFVPVRETFTQTPR